MVEKKELICICCNCFKIRVDDEWVEYPNLLEDDTHDLSHGICPDCIKKLYPKHCAS